MPTYFDSNTLVVNGDGLTQGSPKKDISGFAITNTNANTRDIRIAGGSVFNLTASITSAAATPAGKITFSKYGSGANPVIYSSTTGTSHSGWYRCDPSEFKSGTQGTNIVTTTQAALNSNVWYKKGMGTAWLFGDAGSKNANGTHWGKLRKIISAPTEGSWPSADYHIAEIYVTKINGATLATPETGTIFWSEDGKDPLDYYGITLAQTTDSLIKIVQPIGGFEFSEIDHGPSTQLTIDIALGSNSTMCAPVIIRNFRQDRSLGMRIASNTPSDSTARTNTIGINGLLIEGITAKNIGNAFIGNWGTPYNSSHVLNDAIIRHNVVAGVCERFSIGGIYLLQCRTNNGSKIQVYENTISGAKRDNVWPDGYAIYMDYSCEDYDVYRNYVWDCDLSFRNNGTTGTGIVRENVAVAKVGASASSSAFGSNNPNDVNEAANITYAYNIAVGFNKFIGFQDLVSGSTFNIHHNVSIGKAGAPFAMDSRDAVGFTVDYNNFFGYANYWSDTFAPYPQTTDLTSLANHRITSDPSTAFANGGINLTPTDTEFNYAIGLPNLVWSGTAPSYGGGTTHIGTGANTVDAVTSSGAAKAISNATGATTTASVTSTGSGTVSISATGSTTAADVTSTGSAGVAVSAIGGNEVEVISYGEAVLLEDTFTSTITLDDVISDGAATVDIVAYGENTVTVFSDGGTSFVTVSIVAEGANVADVSSAGAATCETLCSGASTVEDMTSTGEVDVMSDYVGANTVEVSSSGEVVAYTSAFSDSVLDDVFSSGEIGTTINVVGANTVDDVTMYVAFSVDGLQLRHTTTRRLTPWLTQ